MRHLVQHDRGDAVAAMPPTVGEQDLVRRQTGRKGGKSRHDA